MKWIILFSIYRRGNWWSERWRDWPKVTQLEGTIDTAVSAGMWLRHAAGEWWEESPCPSPAGLPSLCGFCGYSVPDHWYSLDFRGGLRIRTSKQTNEIITNGGQLWERKKQLKPERENMWGWAVICISHCVRSEKALRLRSKNQRGARVWWLAYAKVLGQPTAQPMGNYKMVARIDLATRRRDEGGSQREIQGSVCQGPKDPGKEFEFCSLGNPWGRWEVRGDVIWCTFWRSSLQQVYEEWTTMWTEGRFQKTS